MKSLSMSIKETPSKNVRVPARKFAGQKRFGMLPADVMANSRLSLGAKVVFAAMAMESYSSGECSISFQAIAVMVGATRATVSNSVTQLQAEGLIEPIGDPFQQIQSFRLLHPKLAAKQSTETVPDHACAECNLRGRKLNKSCHCPPCARRLRGVHPKVFEAVSQKVDRQMERLVSGPKKRIA